MRGNLTSALPCRCQHLPPSALTEQRNQSAAGHPPVGPEVLDALVFASQPRPEAKSTGACSSEQHGKQPMV